MSDPFAGAGASAGLELWRIEQMNPVKMDTVDGKFYSGDSYILLSTSKSRHSNNLDYHIHFWLGAETSQDESGVAAYKTVELDEALGGSPIQHRECQGHESDLFMSYFRGSGVEYLAGGVESGFNKVERDVWPTRLLQCKGKRSVRCFERPVAAASLNNGDCFILDMGLKLFMFTGEKANRYEKAKALEMMHKIHDERGARGELTFVHEDPHNAEFWEALGGEVAVTDDGEDDEAAAKKADSETKLFRITDSTGDLAVDEIPRNDKGKFTRDMLDSNDAFILDTADKIFVWIGKGATKQERRESMATAMKFVANSGRPPQTKIERIVENGETSLFKSFFHQFDPVMLPSMMKPQASSGVASTPEEKPIDVAAMHTRQATEAPVDDGSGKLTVWRIEDFKKADVAPEKYGQFYGGDSYVLLYEYKDRTDRDAQIIYFWQGNDSTKDEIGASALLAKELDDSMGGSPVQVRVVQGKEPAHFRQLFKGAMVVHQGGKASGFKNSTEGDSYDDDGVGLFHVRGSNALNVHGVQVEEKATSFNSMDCFVLVTPAKVYAWAGSGAIPEEVESAAKIADMLSKHSYGPPGTAAPERTIEAIAEGEEPDEFWDFLGGKAEYAKQPPGEPVPSEPRLFHCSNQYGTFQVEEVTNFGQGDLLDDDVMLLDVGITVYLWIGSGCNETEKTKSMETAVAYNAGAADGRDPNIPIIQIKAGEEPIMFTQFFPGWDADLAQKSKFVDPYEAKLAAMKAAREEADAKRAAEEAKNNPPPATTSSAPAAPTATAAPTPAASSSAPPAPSGGGFLSFDNKFSHDELKNDTPAGVDPTKKERYLSPEDFQTIFKMSLEEFDGLAGWKRKNAKVSAGLF